MARMTKGRLYTRGKKGNYYLQYYVNGKQITVALRDDDGEVITRRDRAAIIAERILSPIKAANSAEQLRQLIEAKESAEQKAERLEAEEAQRKEREAEAARNAKTTIANGWDIFMTCPDRLASCEKFNVDNIPPHTTASNYLGYYKRFSAWLKANHPQACLLSDVTPEIAVAFMERIRGKFASGTYNMYLHFFNRFFNTLIDEGKINIVNPFKKVKRAKHTSNSKKELTREQIKRLIDESTGDLQLLIALGYFTGLRLGDCCTLLWREVDLESGVIKRLPRKIASRTKDERQATVKLGIPPFLRALLIDVTTGERGSYVLPKYAEIYLSGKTNIITNELMAFFKQCGIETYKPGTGVNKVVDENTGEVRKVGSRAVVEIGFHSLRYSYISHHAEAGTPAAVIQRNAGHANPAMTEHYTRISEQAAVQYAQALQLPLGGQEDGLNTIWGEAAERSKLRAAVDTLPIEKIRQLLQIIENEEAGE